MAAKPRWTMPVNVMFSKEMLEAIDEVGKIDDIPRSVVIRRALQLFLADVKKELRKGKG